MSLRSALLATVSVTAVIGAGTASAVAAAASGSGSPPAVQPEYARHAHWPSMLHSDSW